jgi:hypothetical protein
MFEGLGGALMTRKSFASINQVVVGRAAGSRATTSTFFLSHRAAQWWFTCCHPSCFSAATVLAELKTNVSTGIEGMLSSLLVFQGKRSSRIERRNTHFCINVPFRLLKVFVERGDTPHLIHGFALLHGHRPICTEMESETPGIELLEIPLLEDMQFPQQE